MHIGVGSGVALAGSQGLRYETFQLNGLLGTGQSLSLGQGGTPVLSTSQPYTNVMFSGGVKSTVAGDLLTLVPLIEGTFPATETPMSAWANLASALAIARGGSLKSLAAGHGMGSTAYTQLMKGTDHYADGIAQVTAAVARAAGLGLTYGVSAFMVVHGESDNDAGTTNYDLRIREWQADYEADIKPITGQKGTIPHFHSQVSRYTSSLISIAQLKAHVDSRGKVILVGPKYHLPYSDSVHLSNQGYRQLGEEYARVYDHVVVQRRIWEPLRPKTVSRTGAVITIRFYVPTGPLAFDTTIVSAATNMGFDWIGDGTITGVAITSADEVQITLSGVPSPGGHIRYAQSADHRGNLRDSCVATSLHAYPTYNWCVHFDETVI